jgi:calcium-dependent protein kinase
VSQLLNKDPSKRPSAKVSQYQLDTWMWLGLNHRVAFGMVTACLSPICSLPLCCAQEALKHPFLAGDVSDRSKGKQLQRSIVARIQRYAAGSQLKRSVLQVGSVPPFCHPCLAALPSWHKLLCGFPHCSHVPCFLPCSQLMAAELLAQPSTPPPSKGGASTDENDVVVPGIGRVLDSIMHKLKLDEQEAVPTTQVSGLGVLWLGCSVHAEVVGPGGVGLWFLSAGSRVTFTQHVPGDTCLQVAEALHNLGFQLKDTEVSRILAQLDPGRTGIVTRAAFAASQLDWRAIQADHSRWLELARKVFMSLDRDQVGGCSCAPLM